MFPFQVTTPSWTEVVWVTWSTNSPTAIKTITFWEVHMRIRTGIFFADFWNLIWKLQYAVLLGISLISHSYPIGPIFFSLSTDRLDTEAAQQGDHGRHRGHRLLHRPRHLQPHAHGRQESWFRSTHAICYMTFTQPLLFSQGCLESPAQQLADTQLQAKLVVVPMMYQSHKFKFNWTRTRL